MGTLTGLLLPLCCMLAMASTPPPSPVSAHEASALVAAHNQQTSARVPVQKADSGATIQSLPPASRDLSIRRNVRNQAPNRVRRAKKVSRATGPLLRRGLSFSSKPPERAALCILSIRCGRAPPAA